MDFPQDGVIRVVLLSSSLLMQYDLGSYDDPLRAR